MSAPLSIVIPTWRAAERIGPCLGALGEAVMEGLIREVVIADGGSDDAIDAVADAVGARLVTAPRGRGGQLRAGAAAARGDWLLFLHADTVLAPGWAAAIRRHLERGPGRAGYFRLAFDDGPAGPEAAARLVAAWANLRARLFGLPYGDQGLLIHRSLYDRAGGYPDWPLMEDVGLVRRIGRARLARLEALAVTSAERYRRDGWVRRGARNLTTLALFLAGRPPEALVRRYGSGDAETEKV